MQFGSCVVGVFFCVFVQFALTFRQTTTNVRYLENARLKYAQTPIYHTNGLNFKCKNKNLFDYKLLNVFMFLSSKTMATKTQTDAIEISRQKNTSNIQRI